MQLPLLSLLVWLPILGGVFTMMAGNARPQGTVMADASLPHARRLYSLDAARAIAALAVVFQHWEHFASVPAFAAPHDASPLYALFQPLYDKGARAVTFFFCLSGFIFFWLYGDKVRDRKTGPATFAVLRLSRLYPLHLATLLAEADRALQSALAADASVAAIGSIPPLKPLAMQSRSGRTPAAHRAPHRRSAHSWSCS